MKPVQTNRFRFGLVILEQKQKPNWLVLVSIRFDYFILKTKNYIVFWGFFVISNGFDFDLAWFFLFGFLLISVQFGFLVSGLWNQNRTKPVSFLNILIRLIDFFHGLIFLI
jgi:hypothetical protein